MNNKFKDVEGYIIAQPKKFQTELRQLRNVIKTVAPSADERLSYGMPYYDYHGRLAYFRLARGHIGLYIPPPVIEKYQTETKKYATSKATLHLPLDEKLPTRLIEKLIKKRLKLNEQKNKIKMCTRGHKYHGSGPCPCCWPGSRDKKPKKK